MRREAFVSTNSTSDNKEAVKCSQNGSEETKAAAMQKIGKNFKQVM